MSLKITNLRSQPHLPGANELISPWTNYHQTSNIRHILVGDKLVDHSDVVGASPVGAAPTTSSFPTLLLASMDWEKTPARWDENHLNCVILCLILEILQYILKHPIRCSCFLRNDRLSSLTRSDAMYQKSLRSLVWVIPWALLIYCILWSRLALTHWGRVTHMCIGKITIIGSDNGLSPGCLNSLRPSDAHVHR